MQTDLPSRGWLRPGVADLLLIVLLAGIMQRSQGTMLDDPGLGWHLRNIDAMAAEGNWLDHDPFTASREGSAWYTNQWLGDLVLWAGWRWGGLEGIAAVTTIALALIFRQLFHMLSADGVPWPLALFWTFLGAMGASFSWVARPNVFTILGVMITAWTLDRHHREACPHRTTLWLIPLFAVWVNTHGGFVAGLIMLVLGLLVEGLLALGSPVENDRRRAQRRVIHLCRLLPCVFAATLINPYGAKIYGWVFQLVGNPFFMRFNQEWHSPDFHALGAFRFELLMLMLPVCLGLSLRKPSLMSLAMSILWLHFALRGERYVPLYVVVAVPLMARLSAEVPWWRTVGRSLGIPRELQGAFGSRSRRGSPTVACLACLGLLVWSRFCDGYSYHAPEHIPTAALRHVIEEHGDEHIFHHHDWGGWLTWHGWPRLKNWIDDRAEVQGESHLSEYLDLMAARGDWEETLAEQGVTVVCIPPMSSLACRLTTKREWVETYRDDYAVVFVRVSSPKPTASRGVLMPEMRL